MPAIHVRNVPAGTIAGLRERARRHGHSMQQEIREILDAAAAEPLATETPPPIDLVTTHAGTTSTWRREEMYGDEGR